MLRFGIFFALALAAFPQTKAPASVDREQLSNMGLRVVDAAAQARASLAKNDKGQALHWVREGLNNITAIEIARPNAKPPLNVSLYTETVQISVRQPAVKGSAGSADRTAQSPEFVHEAEGQTTRVTLNATQAKQHLQAAQQALDRGDVSSANSALQAVDKDVTAESVVGDLPLLKARQNLAMALGQVRNGQYGAAAVPLRAASEALGEYAGGKSPHAKDAAALRTEIDNLAGNVAQNHTAAEQQIAKWWNQVSDWFTPLQPPGK